MRILELNNNNNNNNKNEWEHFLISITRSKPSLTNKIVMKNYHSHEHYEILILSSNISSTSTFAFYIDNEKYICDSNTVLLSPPDMPHYTSRSQTGFDRIIINFTKRYINDIKSFCGIDVDEIFSKKVLTFNSNSINEIKALAYKMIEEYNANNKSLYLRILLCNFLYLLSFPNSAASPENVNIARFDDIMLYLHKNYQLDLTLKMLENVFFVSKKTICKCIKETSGLSFVEILTNIRLNYARQLLEESKIPISQIPEKVGFNSQSYFSTIFKKHTKLSPTDYRHQFDNSEKSNNS